MRTEAFNTSVATYNSTINGTLDGLHFSLTFRRCMDDRTLSGAPALTLTLGLGCSLRKL